MVSAVARRYAEALAEAVLDSKGKLEPRVALEQLRQFVDLVSSSAELANILASPAVPASRKRAVIGRFAELLPLDPLVRNFLYVVVDRRRTPLLRQMPEALEEVLDAKLGLVRAQVEAAAPLSEDERAVLESALSRVAGRRVRAQFAVNPELLGGVVARVGSVIFDGSIRGRLQALRMRLASQ
jgi:F-type H+-transporting ATPase subunit delta